MTYAQTLTTEAAVRAAVVNAAVGEIGKHYGAGNPTPYGLWYGGKAWERALFCAAGASWSPSKALGEDAAKSILGYQTHGGTSPNLRGFVWTVAMWVQYASRRVGRSQFHTLQPADLLLYKYPTFGTRNTNPVNHVDPIEVNNSRSGYFDADGFNVPRPGAPAGSDQSQGGGVWRRRIWYNNPYLVGGVRLPYGKYAEANRKAWAKVQRILHDLEYGKFSMSGNYGPATEAAIEDYAEDTGYTGDRTDHTTLLTHLENTVSKLDTIENKIDKLQASLAGVHDDVVKANRPVLTALADLPSKVALAVVGYTNKKVSPLDLYALVRTHIHPQTGRAVLVTKDGLEEIHPTTEKD